MLSGGRLDSFKGFQRNLDLKLRRVFSSLLFHSFLSFYDLEAMRQTYLSRWPFFRDPSLLSSGLTLKSLRVVYEVRIFSIKETSSG